MKTLSLDLRERIVAAYDEQQGSRDEVARRFRVSLGMVKKLLQQRRRTKDLGPRHRYSGRKAKVLPEHGGTLAKLVAEQPDLTLVQIKEKLDMKCSIQAVHYALNALGLTYKKRHSTPPSKVGQTSPRHGKSGRLSRVSSKRADWSSSTSQRPRRT